jgi:tartrate-resistant acid phosphatase type 5
MRYRPTLWCSLVLLLLAGALLLGCSRDESTAGTNPAAGPAITSTSAAPTTLNTDAPTTVTTGAPATITTTAGDGAAVVATFAVIGDYGMDDEHEAAVAELVASWHPAYVLATGDDYYSPAGGEGTAKYDNSTGAYYGAWLKDITTTGTRCPVGLAKVNAFFPCLGNHDYGSATPAPATYLTYFDLPGSGFDNSSGNERYYDFVEGPIHFFVLNSNSEEPDGTTSTSKQAQWLKAQMAVSTSIWNIVYDHHPPYSSDLVHGSNRDLQWPFAAWGADAVLSGHAHAYERVQQDGIVYFVNGLGGAPRYIFGIPVGGSQVRYNSDWGAQRVTVTADALVFEFWSAGGRLIDSYTVPARR